MNFGNKSFPKRGASDDFAHFIFAGRTQRCVSILNCYGNPQHRECQAQCHTEKYVTLCGDLPTFVTDIVYVPRGWLLGGSDEASCLGDGNLPATGSSHQAM